MTQARFHAASTLEACGKSMSAGASLSFISLPPSIAFEMVVSEHLQPLKQSFA